MILADANTEIFGKINPPAGTPAGADPLGAFIGTGVQAFFVIAGIAALIYLLRGAFSWIISGGDKEKLQKAQAMLRNAIVGLLLIVVVLSVMITLEDYVFNKKICFGIRRECPIKLPNINTPGGGGAGDVCNIAGDTCCSEGSNDFCNGGLSCGTDNKCH